MEKFAASQQVDAAFAQLNAYWDELLSRYHVESQDPHVNRMANIWNQYQCMVTFNMVPLRFLLRIRNRTRHGIP